MVICRLAPTSCTVLSCESRGCGAGVTGCPALSVRMASLRSTHEVTTHPSPLARNFQAMQLKFNMHYHGLNKRWTVYTPLPKAALLWVQV